MSIRVMSQVWRDPDVMDAMEVLVLIALADHANNDGECWPGIQSLAVKCRLTERCVRKVIKRLATSGKLIITPGGGRFNTNRYKITLNVVQCLEDGNPEHESTKPGTRRPQTLNGAPLNPERGSAESSLTTTSTIRGIPLPNYKPIPDGTWESKLGTMLSTVQMEIRKIEEDRKNFLRTMTREAAESIEWLRQNGGTPERIKEIEDKPTAYEYKRLLPDAAAAIKVHKEREKELERLINGRTTHKRPYTKCRNEVTKSAANIIERLGLRRG
jgi:hypothetical protein